MSVPLPVSAPSAVVQVAPARSARTRALCKDSSWARYSVYLLYWYKSTSTDAEGAARARAPLEALTILVLKYTY